MRRPCSFLFVDQYNAEFNRTVQPMKGGYSDNYYMQMVMNIRKFKGVRPIPLQRGYRRVYVDGRFDDWRSVVPEYLDTYGDTMDRDHPGYGGLHYADTSGRNDIVRSKVAAGHSSIWFYVETADKLTPHTDPHWMLLLIDADRNPDTGWYGYDYLINKHVMDANTTTLMRYKDRQWVEAAQLPYRVRHNKLEIEVSRRLLRLPEGVCSFDFKWADNPADLVDPISLCIHGDTAPNRRFNYRYQFRP